MANDREPNQIDDESDLEDDVIGRADEDDTEEFEEIDETDDEEDEEVG